MIVALLSLPAAGLLYVLFHLLHASSASVPDLNSNGVFIFIALLIAGIVLHEGLHAIGWIVFGKLPLSRVKFGFRLRTLTPYAHLRGPIQARTYRIGILLPLLLLGLPPYLVGIILGRQAFMIYGLFFILAAGGDLLVLWLLRGLPKNTWVEDHPTRAGCRVHSQPQYPAPVRDDSN